ncbi:carbohydrate kinase family protein [Mesobacillus subterraneus]|uniref:carbohydrate kinase family protein n=1 Tax=Mesobacillus subterraneus TaxID=285983 RepID=UPI001CFD420F|nr:carbohydrate kinase [Mesobacillus subterraneus]
MGMLYSIGEVLIDFIPQQKGKALKDVVTFERMPGGAPANVSAAVARYGQDASIITKLGEDGFGDFLIEQLEEAGVRTDMIVRTKQANTGLAFVSLREDGERDFSFYRKPSADLLLEETELDASSFGRGDILHFCSVDLVESPMKQTHRKAINRMKEQGGIISFDPNVRLPLWDSAEDCRSAILEFLPSANIVKISDEELEFITGIHDEQEAIQSLFQGDVQAVVFTKGANGADLYVGKEKYGSNGFTVKVEDTTGAGDAFIGGFLYKLLELGATSESLLELLHDQHADILRFANASGALTTTKRGAISALPTRDEIEKGLSDGRL